MTSIARRRGWRRTSGGVGLGGRLVLARPAGHGAGRLNDGTINQG